MRKTYLALTIATVVAACGGGGGGTAKAPSISQPATVPDYSNLKTSAPDDSGLRKPQSAGEFEQSLRNGLRLLAREGGQGGIYTAMPTVSDSGAESPGGSPGGNFSDTNVQVEGVDEGDLVKYDGRYLYIYQPGHYDQEGQVEFGPSLRIVATDPAQPVAQLAGELPMREGSESLRELYLVQGTDGTEAVAAISQAWAFRALGEPMPADMPADDMAGVSLIAPGENSTRIELVDTGDPANPAITWTLELEGSLEASRKIGNTLYLVSRHYPNPPLDFYPVTDEDRIALEEKIAALPVEDLLPEYSINGGSKQLLTDPENCLVPGSMEQNEGLLDIVTVTAIDLGTRRVSDSLCMNSPANGVYASVDNLYIGATIADYDAVIIDETPIPVESDGGTGGNAGIDVGEIVGTDDTPIPVEPDGGIGDSASIAMVVDDGPIPVETDGGIGDGMGITSDDDVLMNETPIPVEPDGGIGDTPPDVVVDPLPGDPDQGLVAPYPEEYTVFHKIALGEGQVTYRASGKVAGSLGWHAPQFRMDEYQGDLRVVTTADNGIAPRHQLTVLRESGDVLDVIATLPNDSRPEAIGKPGENIYAVRFFGPRAFIVTFRQIDPLYTLDLSDPFAPAIAGALEIPGYSSYLHPINENWLLSVGSEVVDNRNGGVKVELFDISGGDARSAGVATFGKPGSWSPATWDHRALNFLSVDDGDTLRFTVPINLADTPVDWSTDYFDWTQTALHLFSVQGVNSAAASLQEDGSIIGETRSETVTYPQNYPDDRGVLHDDAVFYVHGGKVISAPWDAPEAASPEQ